MKVVPALAPIVALTMSSLLLVSCLPEAITKHRSLRAMLKYPEGDAVCRALAISLSRIGPAVFYDVIAALGHEHPNVRQFAAGLLYGLAQRGGVVIEDAVPALAGALQDADCRVRQKAAVTLSFIGPAAEAAVFQLTEALSDRDDFVREWAAHALTSIGSAAESAVPALVDRLDDQEPAVRQAASDALVSI